jgi:hypothetical protein
MRFVQEMPGGRREFLRAAARYTLLAAISAAGYLSTRTGKLKGQSCISQGICNGCLQFANCGLPAALSRKETERGTKA